MVAITTGGLRIWPCMTGFWAVPLVGRVVDGMDVVHAILALPTNGTAQNPVMQGQILSPPVVIVTMRRV